MKSLYIILLLAVIGGVFSCNKVTLSAFEVAFNDDTGKQVKISFHYKNHTLAFHTLDEKNISSTIFKLIWEFSNQDEAKKAQDVLKQISPYLEETRVDEQGLLINFFAYHMKTLKNKRKSEFGTVYKIEIQQKQRPVDVSFMVVKNQEMGDLLEQTINNIFAKPQEELKFLA